MPPGALSTFHRSSFEENAHQLSGVQGNLMSANGGRDLGVVMVTSSVAAEGTTFTTLSLGYALSVLGSATVLIVDCNGASPSAHALFHHPRAPGLTDYVVADASMSSSVQSTEFPRLHVMTIGAESSAAVNVHEAPTFGQKLDELRQHHDFVLLDAPPVLTSSAPCVMAPSVDGIVVVIRCEATRWEMTRRATDKLRAVGGKLTGCVLNRRAYHVPSLFYR